MNFRNRTCARPVAANPMFPLPLIASALLPFRRTRTSVFDAEAVEPETAPPVSLTIVPSIPIMSTEPSPATRAINAMLLALEPYLIPLVPAPSPPLPDPSLSLVSVVERMVGLGSHVGTDNRGPFNVAALKGLRLEAVVRFQLWAATPSEVEQAINELIGRLLGDRDVLRIVGFLRLALKHTSPSENVFAEDAWRQMVEFEVLYEFPFVDSDDAQSLIAQIPIKVKDNFTEITTVTDEMTRWDNESAPALAVRGVLSVGQLSALAFIPATAPAGKVMLTRTFDGAPGPTPIHPDLPAFLAAVTDPVNPAREAQVEFASLSVFIAAFTAAGTPITLGDWDKDLVPDEYQSLELIIDPPIKLPGVSDRFELTYALTPSATDFAVVYLRATRRLSI